MVLTIIFGIIIFGWGMVAGILLSLFWYYKPRFKKEALSARCLKGKIYTYNNDKIVLLAICPNHKI